MELNNNVMFKVQRCYGNLLYSPDTTHNEYNKSAQGSSQYMKKYLLTEHITIKTRNYFKETFCLATHVILLPFQCRTVDVDYR